MSQPHHDVFGVEYNYDLFDDTMDSSSINWGVDTITTSPGTIYTINNIGSPGQTLTWDGTNPAWTTPTLEIDKDVKELKESIQNIEKRLAILHPNQELEERWEQLKQLGEEYRALEKDILEKEKIWETLKK